IGGPSGSPAIQLRGILRQEAQPQEGSTATRGRGCVPQPARTVQENRLTPTARARGACYQAPMAATRASAITLGAEWSLAVVAAELATLYVLSTLPTPLYPIYQDEFGFSQLVLTLIFAAYVVGTASAMFFLGRLSDQVGRWPVVMVAL